MYSFPKLFSFDLTLFFKPYSLVIERPHQVFAAPGVKQGHIHHNDIHTFFLC